MFRERPDTEVEWQLFKVAVASSAAWVCRRKWVDVANNGKKVTSWWNKEVKFAIQAKKRAYKAWLQNKTDSSLHLRYAEGQKSALRSLHSQKVQNALLGGFST